MDRFSYVMVLLSIIVGLGITELLSNTARQIQLRTRAKFYWVHGLLVIAVFVALLQQWWEGWDQRNVEAWSFHVMLLMLGGPIGLYIIAHLLYPKQLDGLDFKRFYYESPRTLYVIAAITTIIGTAYRPVAFGDVIIDPDNAASAVMVLAFLVLAATRRERVHTILVPLILAAILLDVFIFIPTIE
ncbi:MAG: hypothetical protein AAF996_01115 [Pseudomonadota bacterium]